MPLDRSNIPQTFLHFFNTDPQHMILGREGLVSFSLGPRVIMDNKPERFLHGPAAVAAPNGDWLVAYQNGLDDPGRDSFISQMRSRDQGRTWAQDGIVYDERDKRVGSRNPTFGLTGNGKIILVVQRASPDEKLPHPESLLNSTYCLSSDNGKSYGFMGYADVSRPRGHFGSSSHILLRDGLLYMVAYSLDGIVLYVSDDNAESWRRRSLVFQPSEFHEDPYYPTIVFRPDGSLLCQCHLDRAMENYQKVSEDNGFTWTEWKPANIRLRHPVLAYVEDVLIAVGRLMPVRLRAGFYMSADHGDTWTGPFDLAPDLPNGGGGYTAVIPLGDRVFVVFSYCIPPARDTYLQANSILGVTLSNVSM